MRAAEAAPAENNVVLVAPAEDAALVLDATTKEHIAMPGELACTFRFRVKNVSKSPVVINQVRTTCGCTVAKLPSQPWRLAPGSEGILQLDVDLRGKSGVLIKTATLDTATSFKELTIVVRMPEIEAVAATKQDRAKNREMATADRQAVFQGDCAACHSAPTIGKTGAALYAAACGICHEAKQRATMVPDLHALARADDAEFWRTTILHGKKATLMPAFAQSEGGPLSRTQVDGLVAYLLSEFRAGARR